MGRRVAPLSDRGGPADVLDQLGMRTFRDGFGWVAWTPNLRDAQHGLIPARVVGSDHNWMWIDLKRG